MLRIGEFSKFSKVTIKALRYYDKIGLLPPAKYTEAGYRLYDDAALETLQQILLFRELVYDILINCTFYKSYDIIQTRQSEGPLYEIHA